MEDNDTPILYSSDDDYGSPPKSSRILLVDANGEDERTKFVYKARKKYITVSNDIQHLQGQNEAIRAVFRNHLLHNSSLEIISYAGHGNLESLAGYIRDEQRRKKNRKEQHYPNKRILRSGDVNKSLAKGKIFHSWSCYTGEKGGLGEMLVKNGATAFIGYDKKIDIDLTFDDNNEYTLCYPDCIIVNEIIEEENINREKISEIVVNAKMDFGRMYNEANPLVGRLAKANGDALQVYPK